MAVGLRDLMFRIWYWYVNNVDKNDEILFMNYGFSDGDKKTNLESSDEVNRYSIQLYHHLASAIDIADKDILEVGCGRGGGLAFITKTLKPSSALGVDLDKRAVKFCNRFHKSGSLSYLQGDAQKLSLGDSSFDVVLNVESSHRYPDMPAFLSEICRILRPKGYFLFTDFRYDHELSQLRDELLESGMALLMEEEITPQVATALEHDDSRRRNLVKKLAPKVLHKLALNFAGTIGSETYNQFAERKYVYMNYILQKL